MCGTNVVQGFSFVNENLPETLIVCCIIQLYYFTYVYILALLILRKEGLETH